MKGSRLAVFLVALLLAIGSFAYARHRYEQNTSFSLKAGDANLSFGFADKKLFGDWVRDELVFAVIVPVALIAGGAALTIKK